MKQNLFVILFLLFGSQAFAAVCGSDLGSLTEGCLCGSKELNARFNNGDLDVDGMMIDKPIVTPFCETTLWSQSWGGEVPSKYFYETTLLIEIESRNGTEIKPGRTKVKARFHCIYSDRKPININTGLPQCPN